MNHYPRHVGDYLRKTIGLTLAQDGAYTRMVDLYYSDERPLNPDRAMLYADLRCHSKADRDAVDFVLRKYFTETPEGFRNKRCDEEIAKFADKSAKARAAGEASGKARGSTKHEHTLNGRSADVEQTLNQPITSNQEPVKARAVRARAPATLLPSDWKVPLDWLLWAERERREWTDADLHRCAGIFADHWRSKGEARSDWEATWRNWVRRERSTKVNGTQHEARMDVADQIFKRGKYASGGTKERDITSTAERVD